MKNKYIYLSALALGLVACEPEFKNEIDGGTYSSGDADFTSYVALGNSLTAGYMDGTVFRTSQQNSFPKMLSEQFAVAGGGEFTQPSYEEDAQNKGGLTLMGNVVGATRMIINAQVGGPQNIAGTPSIEVSNLQQRAYHNMGVPGAKSFHLLAEGYGNIQAVALGKANPYFVRHATSPTATVLGDAMSMNPTFFTNWIGSNDILSYATNGGAQADGQTPALDHNETGNLDSSTYGSNDITNAQVFQMVYANMTNILTSNGAKGVVATIPAVTSIPYFTTVPYNPITAEVINANPQAALLKQLFQFLAQATGGRIQALKTTPGQKNPVLIYDADLTDIGAQITSYANASGNATLMALSAQLGAIYGKARSATSQDLMVLPSSSVIGTVNANSVAPLNVNGVTFPLQNKWVLTVAEQEKVTAAVTQFNSIIRSVAQSKGLAIADMNQILGSLANNDRFNGGLVTEDGQRYFANYFSTENLHTTLFSLDGVHPNAKGYAVITNEIIKVINKHYNAKLPMKDPSSYPGATILVSNN